MAGAREQYKTLFDLAPDPIFVANQSSATIQDANDLAVETLGYSKDQLVGMELLELHPSQQAELYRRLFEQTLSEGTLRTRTLPDGSQLQFVTAEGDRIPIELHARTVAIDGEQLTFGIARDISEQIAVRERVESQRDLLDVLNQVVRHDLRNDLQIVETYTELLDDEIDEDATEYLETIQQCTRNAVEFTQTAGDLAEVIQNPEIERRPTTVRPMLIRQCEELEQMHQNAVISLADSPAEVTVLATELLESVFRNLLQNAVQHTDSDRPSVDILLETDEVNATIRIADNGRGVPDGQKTEIFGKGEKGLESDGSGLGLYLAKTLVNSYGGNIWVEDNDPTGSVFVVELPLADRE
ncbi:PAS domain-containing sensor histidine kinase [Halovenus salina]|uniref:histidine kinase n=1 Tax=Halovenus salina TaxID=1510225 RepID=A0ABD5W9T7_9EURY|nr:PAS domain-containing sensor histidine kinase [Halovenus salina]